MKSKDSGLTVDFKRDMRAVLERPDKKALLEKYHAYFDRVVGRRQSEDAPPVRQVAKVGG